MADHKQVLVVYKERRKVFKIPQECDIGHIKVEVVRAFDFKNVSVTLQQYNATFEEYVDADSDCEVKDKEKLQAVVTSFDRVSFLKLIYNIYGFKLLI